jgi:hypothetical protein
MRAVDCIIRYYFNRRIHGRLDDDATVLRAEWHADHQHKRDCKSFT